MTKNNPIKFDSPATYKILVQGNLPEKLHSYFLDMKIENESSKRGIDSISLTGNVRDQAALAGILNMLYEFHCSILLVEYIEEKIPEAEPLENGAAS